MPWVEQRQVGASIHCERTASSNSGYSEHAVSVHWQGGLYRNTFNFVLGGVAGAFGAAIVYPIDFVKTRMQNQRNTPGSRVLYKSYWDCVSHVLKNEGILAFYQGVGIQALGVAPSRAIKLSANDFVRQRVRDPSSGEISLQWEILAGCFAGAVHVIFANPQEFVKIRLQVQGERAGPGGAAPLGAVRIARQIGLSGLYKGSVSCLLRDVPFAAIYFPVFAHLKKDVFLEGQNGRRLSFWETLAAASMAGVPASFLVTPPDLIKTRLQVEARSGQTKYSGTADAFRKIVRDEGFKTLYKGSLARIMRSSPQYGGALAAYEYLQRLLHLHAEDERSH